MGLKKSAGILVFCIQGVITYDYFIQTRDAGLNWGDLSTTEYRLIVQDRFARARAGEIRAARVQAPDSAWDRLAGLSQSFSNAFNGSGQYAAADTAELQEPQEPPKVCVRRGNVPDC